MTTEQQQAPAPPHNLEAEESVLGAMLISPKAIGAVAEILEADHFYRPSYGTIYRAAIGLWAQGEPVDGITLADRLEDLGELAEAGGKAKIAELAALVPAASNAGHYAQIVRQAARDRDVIRIAQALQRAGQNGGLPNHPDVLADLERLLDSPGGTRTIAPLWWHEAMQEAIPDTIEYVAGVLQAGVVADIVGLPYLHKTAIALELATKIARGTGRFLGRHDILRQAQVGYFWADDSRGKELERIQAYGERHDLGVLPVALFLNPGLLLPNDLGTVRTLIREHGLRVVIFDSLYNFAPGIDWTKDHARVTQLYAALKRLCDQIDGLTIILVDHAAKPSESNRDRQAGHSSFGSVFKAASVRCTIAVEKRGEKLFLSCTGNNIRGFGRTPAFWAEDELEVRLVEETRQQIDEGVEQMIRNEVLTYIAEHPGESSNKVRKGVRRGNDIVYPMLSVLAAEGLIVNQNDQESLLETSPEGSQEKSGEVGEVGSGTPRNLSSGELRRGQKTSWLIVAKPHETKVKPLLADSQERSGEVSSPGDGQSQATSPENLSSPEGGGGFGESPEGDRDPPTDDIEWPS